MLGGAKYLLCTWSLVSQVAMSSDVSPQTANPTLTPQRETHKNIGASLKFLLSSKTLLDKFKRQSSDRYSWLHENLERIVDDKCLMDGVCSKSLDELYDTLFKDTKFEKDEYMQALPLRVFDLLQQGMGSQRISGTQCNILLMNDKEKSASASIYEFLPCLNAPDDYNKYGNFNQEQLVDEAIKRSAHLKRQYENMKNNLVEGSKIVKTLLLPQFVVFNGGMRSDPKQITRIFQEDFAHKQYVENTRRPKYVAYNLKSILYASDNCMSGWEVMSFDEEDTDISTKMETLFADSTKKLLYVLYEREQRIKVSYY
ncbi:hypothetical protein ENBRE01_2342 [Enteropsectra breve]|nr:hypothetical protein ENBRE01_2342 [Enteropsectra breve]